MLLYIIIAIITIVLYTRFVHNCFIYLFFWLNSLPFISGGTNFVKDLLQYTVKLESNISFSHSLQVEHGQQQQTKEELYSHSKYTSKLPEEDTLDRLPLVLQRPLVTFVFEDMKMNVSEPSIFRKCTNDWLRSHYPSSGRKRNANTSILAFFFSFYPTLKSIQ